MAWAALGTCSPRVSSLKGTVARATAELYGNLGLTPCALTAKSVVFFFSLGFEFCLFFLLLFFHLGCKDKCHWCQLSIAHLFVFQQYKHMRDCIPA